MLAADIVAEVVCPFEQGHRERQMSVRTANELAGAMQRRESEIVVVGDLKNQVVTIRAIGTIAWAALGVIVAGAILLIVSTGGVGAAFTAPAFAPVVAIAGISATKVILILAAAGGGMGLLNVLRQDYYVAQRDPDKLVLRRR